MNKDYVILMTISDTVYLWGLSYDGDGERFTEDEAATKIDELSRTHPHHRFQVVKLA